MEKILNGIKNATIVILLGLIFAFPITVIDGMERTQKYIEEIQPLIQRVYKKYDKDKNMVLDRGETFAFVEELGCDKNLTSANYIDAKLIDGDYKKKTIYVEIYKLNYNREGIKEYCSVTLSKLEDLLK